MESNTDLSLKIYLNRGFSNIGYTVWLTLEQGNILIIKRRLSISLNDELRQNYARSIKQTIIMYLRSIGVSDIIDEDTPIKRIKIDQKYQNTLTLFIKNFDTGNYTDTVLNPVIIKFNEKHGDRFYLARSEEEAKGIYFLVLKERFDQKYYSYMKDYIPYQMKNLTKPEYTIEDINTMTISGISSIQDFEELKKRMKERVHLYYKLEKDQIETREKYFEIEKVLEQIDGVGAYNILSDFKEGEYEGFEIIDPENLN